MASNAKTIDGSQKTYTQACPNFPDPPSQNKSVNGRVNGVNGKVNRLQTALTKSNPPQTQKTGFSPLTVNGKNH
jgi:hypothetical protein